MYITHMESHTRNPEGSVLPVLDSRNILFIPQGNIFMMPRGGVGGVGKVTHSSRLNYYLLIQETYFMMLKGGMGDVSKVTHFHV